MDKLKRLKCCVRRWCKRRRTGKDAKQGLKGAVDMESTQVLGETMPENTLLGTQRGGRTEKMDEYETYVPRDQLAPPLRSGFQARKKRFTSTCFIRLRVISSCA
ncbi:uncharacterized protein LOC129597291 [Paramacrobiotus metropolitanus]|uniref:uncharacterized protein LOC129597291 n=1 Tax=Paramacrobiotus metropolitanus TaxID=2943436 RepID=UPI0024458C08|nr:uncharacterized protein LOC129597291 [Paramacrobiotus metropolitanus]